MTTLQQRELSYLNCSFPYVIVLQLRKSTASCKRQVKTLKKNISCLLQPPMPIFYCFFISISAHLPQMHIAYAKRNVETIWH